MPRPPVSPAPRPVAVRPARARSLTLLESGRSLSSRHALETMLGMLLHGTVVVGTFLAVTYRPGGDAPQPADKAPVFLAPEQEPVSRGTQERLQYIGLSAGPVPMDATESAFDGDAGTTVTVPGTDSVVVASDEEPEIEEFVLSEIDVDSAVVPDPESGGPAYPESLLDQNVEGVVLARFIVDSTGRVQAGSFLALEATHPLFTQAVRDALPRMKFRPAFVGQKRVPQLVVQSFAFRIAKRDTLVRDTLAVREPAR